jgi:hypothetical protein
MHLQPHKVQCSHLYHLRSEDNLSQDSNGSLLGCEHSYVSCQVISTDYLQMKHGKHTSANTAFGTAVPYTQDDHI